jgi:hypothetical protein
MINTKYTNQEKTRQRSERIYTDIRRTRMKIRGSIPDSHGPYSRLPKKRPISETNLRRMSTDMLMDRADPDADFIELEGGFTMYPSEVLGFSDGSDSLT